MCSDSFKMFLHFVESRLVLNNRKKYFKPILLHKQAQLPDLSREKSEILKHTRGIESPGGIIYIVPPPPPVESRRVFSICVCGNCNAHYRSLKPRAPRPRV